jgi:putative transposase
VHLLKRTHQRVRCLRRDVQHTTALALLRQYDVGYVEAMQPATVRRRPAPLQDENGGYEHNGASRKAGLSKSIADVGWGQEVALLTILAYTAAWAGKRVDAVSPAYTSQGCSGCGKRIHTSLSVRTHVCPNCGLILDRDLNAARTIHWRGQRLRRLAGLPAGRNREPVGL